MRVFTEPSPAQWRLGAARGAATPVIATGHQAWHWHPGILAKDLAMVAAARRTGAATLHLMVDHDPAPCLDLDLPVVRGREALVHRLRLADYRDDLPPVLQPAVDPGQVLEALHAVPRQVQGDLPVSLAGLMAAWTSLPPAASLAEQMALVLAGLLRPLLGEVPMRHASGLADAATVQRLCGDAEACVRAYNQAVARHPQAQMRPLRVAGSRFELPLWLLLPQVAGGRARVLADHSDPRRPRLVCEDASVGLEADGCHDPRLAPRALLLTALLRRHHCDLFIHGKGGGLYDRITEDWWGDWTGENLAPMAVVSADLHLDLGVPVAEPAERARTQWWSHHLPHNLDRALGLDGPLPREKRAILAHMDDDRDRARRAAAFARLKAINAELAGRHTEPLAQAEQALADTAAGIRNRAIARRRDWCFALYPPAQLEGLRQAFEGVAPV